MRWLLAMSMALALGFLGHPALAQDTAQDSSKATSAETSTTSRPGTTRAAISKAASGTMAAPAPRPAPPPQRHEETTPKAEAFLGYSYLRANPGSPIQGINLNGGSGSIAFNANNWFGIVADFGGYKLSNVTVTGSPSVSADGTVFTYLFGPRLSYRRHDRVTPFAQALFGGAHQGDVTAGGSTVASSQNAFAMTIGGGFDVKVNRHVAIRLVQAEYLLTRFKDPSSTTGARAAQNNARISAGIVFRLGTRKAVPNVPPVASCSAANTSVYAESGDLVNVRVRASDPDNDPLTYSWTTSGGTVEGSGPEVRWNSSRTTPRTYTVKVRVDDGRGGTADCSVDIRVEPRPNRPPTMSCSADRSSVSAGEPVQINATASDPDNDPLTFSWDTTGGRIIGSGSSVRLDTSGLAPNRHTVTGRVNDGRGGAADCSVNVDVQRLAEEKQLETRLALHSIYFQTARPTVSNPSGGLVESQQEVLRTLAGDFKRYLTFKPDAHLILNGHADVRGSVEYNKALTERRVARTKSFLVEQGVPAASIETRAFGKQDNLNAGQVRQLIEQNPDLSAEDRRKILSNLQVIVLANNRRVDVALSTTGQQSVRRYPFNAKDSLTLLSTKGGGTEKGSKPAAKKKTKKQ